MAGSNLQRGNREWWEEHPMVYQAEGWGDYEDEVTEASTLERKTFEETDRRFFEAARWFAHPQGGVPFGALIPYGQLKGKRVLEIGCGAGSIALLFRKAGSYVVAVDLTQQATRLTKRRLELFDQAGRVIQCDAEWLALPDRSVDHVWSWGVIHHSSCMEKIVSEIWRVLKPGGRAQVMVYHRNSVRYYLDVGWEEGIWKRRLFRGESLEELNKSVTDGYLARHLTKSELRCIFRDFVNIRLRTFDVVPRRDLPLLSRIYRWLLPSRWSAAIDRFLLLHFGWLLFIEASKPPQDVDGNIS